MRRRRRAAAILLLLLAVWWIGNFTLHVQKTVIRSAKLTDAVTIVQITDLHGAVFGKGNRRLLRAIERQKPDLVLATGDLYTNDSNGGRQTARDLLAALARQYAVYYVCGEHDYGYQGDTSFTDALTQAGVTVLHYRDEIVQIRGTKLHLYGINNVYFPDSFDLANAFAPDPQNCSVLLAHIPNFEKYAAFGIDVSLCGDTHGGMFRLPFLGAVYDGETLFPELKGKPIKGLYEKDGAYMYISAGLGSYPAPVRFCNRPEVTVIRLEPAE